MPRRVASIEYEKRLLLFVDVLGWSNLTSRSATDPAARRQIGAVIGRLLRGSAVVRLVEGALATVLSDSWAVSVPARPEDVEMMLELIAVDLALPLLRHGCYLRGSIVLGDLFHRANVIVGPGLVQAVGLEKAACYPRIVIDPSASQVIPPVGSTWISTGGKYSTTCRTARRTLSSYSTTRSP